MSRLEKRGKGSILLLHDIHPATVAALPGLLEELKDRGYHIVVAPAPAEPDTVGGPEVWPQGSGLPDHEQLRSHRRCADTNGRRQHAAIRRAGSTASASATKPTWNRQGD
jgi:hypothetical protein